MKKSLIFIALLGGLLTLAGYAWAADCQITSYGHTECFDQNGRRIGTIRDNILGGSKFYDSYGPRSSGRRSPQDRDSKSGAWSDLKGQNLGRPNYQPHPGRPNSSKTQANRPDNFDKSGRPAATCWKNGIGREQCIFH